MNEMTRIIGSTIPTTPFTADDFQRMIDAGVFADMRAELVDGVIEKMMPANLGHGERHFSMIGELYAAYRGSGFRLAADLAVRIDDTTVRAPDIAVLQPIVGGRLVEARDVVLAVEISDTTLSRDLGAKAIDYAASGIAHYWVVDLQARIVRLMSDPGEAGYASQTVVRFGEAIAVPGTDATITID